MERTWRIEISHHVIDASGPTCSAALAVAGIVGDRTHMAWFKLNSTGKDRYPVNISAEQICRLAESGGTTGSAGS